MQNHLSIGRVLRLFVVSCWCIGAALAILPDIAGAQEDRTDPARQPLRQAIEQADKIPESDYSIESWNAMRMALDDARRKVRDQNTSRAELEQAFTELKKKVSALAKRKVLPDNSPRAGLSASLFATDPAWPVNNVQLMWAVAEPVERVQVSRAVKESGPWEKIYTGAGASFNDYALPEGSYFYRMEAFRGSRKHTSNVARIVTMPMPAGLKTYSNQTANERGLPEEQIKAGDTYYQFRTVREDKAVKLIQRTSKDGENWEDGPVVMDAGSHPDLADCKFEAVNIFYDEVNDQIVFWCHWELSGPHYGHGRALVATAKPGERFKVHHNYNPLGIQVRDMSTFVDDDKQGYLVAASNVPGQGANATLYIFKLNKTYDDVVEIVAKVIEGGYREAPHIVKHDGLYYLFFSQAAGWYPSRGGYISAPSLEGRWSEPRSIGNPATFSSQSGGILHYEKDGERLHVMMGNRWIRGEDTNRNVALPLHLAGGFAFYDYAPTLLHDLSRNILVPLHMGKLLSQDQPARASIPGKPGHEIARAFDGDYNTFFQSDEKKWPFELTTDLGAPCGIRNVQVSWFLHKGSEAFYTYTIEGSLDGKQWTTLVDRANPQDAVISKTYGFTSDVLPEGSPARYVRVTVQRAHLHNNPNNWYPPTVYEIKVFGDAGAEQR